MLQSYILKFNFKTDSGFLDYLNGTEFVLPNKLGIKKD